MNRSKFREFVVTLLYITSVNGEYNEDSYDGSVLLQTKQVLEVLPRIDDIIEKNLTNWTLDRLNYMDLAIIRYATYEMLMTDTPKEIVINEAINLTKKYTNLDDNKQAPFNNKLLDQIALTIKRVESNE